MADMDFKTHEFLKCVDEKDYTGTYSRLLEDEDVLPGISPTPTLALESPEE